MLLLEPPGFCYPVISSHSVSPCSAQGKLCADGQRDRAPITDHTADVASCRLKWHLDNSPDRATARRGSKLVKCSHCICCLQSSKAAHPGLSLQSLLERSSHSYQFWSLMVPFGHYCHSSVIHIESTETANPRSGPGLSADLIHLYQTPQPFTHQCK